MTKDEFLKLYWRQYQMIERDVIETNDYVTIDVKNYGTFSAQYVKILLNVCSEIDSLLVQMRQLIAQKYPACDIDVKDISILKKIEAVKVEYVDLNKMTVITKRPYDVIKVLPFVKFDEKSSDVWWQDYNKVKHQRDELIPGSNKYYYEKANLKNCISALSAFYLLCVLMYELLDGDIQELESNLFETGYRIFH